MMQNLTKDDVAGLGPMELMANEAAAYNTQRYADVKLYCDRLVELGYDGYYNNIGELHQKGLSIPQDFKKANECFEKAHTDKSHPSAKRAAATNLGVAYSRGEGFERDLTKAVVFLKEAAAAGSVSANGYLMAILDELLQENKRLMVHIEAAPDGQLYLETRKEWVLYGGGA